MDENWDTRGRAPEQFAPDSRRVAEPATTRAPSTAAVERVPSGDEAVAIDFYTRNPSAALFDMRRRLESPAQPKAAPAQQDTVSEFTNELGNAIRITIEGPTSTSENVLTPMEVDRLRQALNSHATPAQQGDAPSSLSAEPKKRTMLQRFRAGEAIDMMYHGTRKRVDSMQYQRPGFISASSGRMLPVIFREDGSYSGNAPMWLEVAPPAPAAATQQNDDGEHVAWLCYREHNGHEPTTLHLCDSDTPDAFMVYRKKQAERPAPAGHWQPIDTANKHGAPVWLFDPALIDEDFNPTGTVDGHWQDDVGWMGAVWDGYRDEWSTEQVNPTHWMPRTKPSDLPAEPKAETQGAIARFEGDHVGIHQGGTRP
jgi:hypothetical protein